MAQKNQTDETLVVAFTLKGVGYRSIPYDVGFLIEENDQKVTYQGQSGLEKTVPKNSVYLLSFNPALALYLPI